MRVARTLLALIVALIALLPVEAAALRIMTYNILNYSAGREPQFRTIMAATQPDVVVIQEILSQSAVDRFRDQVLNVVNPGEWAAGTFVNGADTDNALYYRTAKVTYVSHFVIGTALRDIDEWTFRPVDHASADANVRIYTLHLKASQGSENVQKRLAEVTNMRVRMETFPIGQNYLVAGDFNIYTATESAYIYMTDPLNGLAGVLQDPIGREGNWHNNAGFADIHTQSPRVTQFGGGANGGMDDRFDMVLVGPTVQDEEGFDVLESTHTSFGQDGNHYNGALNVPPYVVVDSVTAQALHDASDHLPVYADFQLYPVLTTDVALDLGTAIVGGVASANLSVANGASLPADELDYSFGAPFGFAAPGGSFTVDAGPSANLHPIDHPAITTGIHGGDLTVTTDDPDRPAELVPLSATVLAHAVPSVDAGQIATQTTLDFGNVASGDTAAAGAAVHNFFDDSFQASLEVWDATLTGDPRFFLPGGFSAFLVAVGSPVNQGMGFDAVGATDGIYQGTLTLGTRDQQNLSGAASLPDLTFDLTVTVGGATGVSGPLASAPDGIRAVAPNPFRTRTSIRFGVERASRVELRIYDVHGRELQTLADGTLPAGVHERHWDGRDSAGRALAPGIYFARLVAGNAVETRKLLRLR